MDSETASFVMGANADVHLNQAKKLRGRAPQLRAGFGAVGGVGYGLSAYGSPIGTVTGVQQPPPPAEGGITPGEAMSSDQFGGGGTPAA